MAKIKPLLFKSLEGLVNFLSKLGISKRTPGALRVYNFLYRTFWPYQNIIEVQGSKMYLDPNEESLSLRATLEDYAKAKIHEKSTTELFKKTVKEGDIVVDLGANIGYFTLLAAKLVGGKGRVYAFEPEPKNYSYLKKNIEINKYDKVEAFQEAVSDKESKIKLYICPYDSGHHTINRYDGIKAYARGRQVEKQEIEIETVTLDKFLQDKEEKVDVIKMDVEGAEYLALLGMDKTIKKNKNLKMFIEFFPLLIKNMGNSPEEFIRKLLEDYNFSVFIIPEDYSASKGDLIEAKNVSDVMKLIKQEEDHINLFLKR